MDKEKKEVVEVSGTKLMDVEEKVNLMFVMKKFNQADLKHYGKLRGGEVVLARIIWCKVHCLILLTVSQLKTM